jgi:hypothetical protein
MIRNGGPHRNPTASGTSSIRLLWSRTATLSLLELAKLRHDRTYEVNALRQLLFGRLAR